MSANWFVPVSHKHVKLYSDPLSAETPLYVQNKTRRVVQHGRHDATASRHIQPKDKFIIIIIIIIIIIGVA